VGTYPKSCRVRPKFKEVAVRVADAITVEHKLEMS
jgi:hypothetical protein